MNIDKEQYIEKYLKDSLRNIIAHSVDEEIDKKNTRISRTVNR